MMIFPQKETFLDKILRRFRRERAVLPPLNMRGILKKFGPYVIVIGKRESFWKTLFKRGFEGKTDFHNLNDKAVLEIPWRAENEPWIGKIDRG